MAMTFSQELADRVRSYAESHFTADPDEVLAAVFHDAVGQWPDTWVAELREDIRRMEQAEDERMNHGYYKWSYEGEPRS